MKKYFTKTNTVIFMAALTLWRCFINATLPLHPDETYYWLWSRHLGLSYYDHPAMVAYFIKATTLFSSSPFWVRFSGIALSLILSVLIWKLAMKLFKDKAVASGSVLMLNITPLTMSGVVIITPDVPSFLFWSLGVYFAWQAFDTKKPVYWYLLSASFGLSLISKYTAVLLAPCLLLYMLVTEDRKWLKTIHPYLAGLLSCLFVIPIILWNIKYDWLSVKFQLGHGLGGQTYSLGKVAEYIGGQMLVLGPFAWLAGIWAAVVFLFKKNKGMLFLSLTSVPVIAFFAFTSLKNAAGPNWPALAYFTFSIIISTYYLLDSTRLKSIVFGTVLLLTFGLSMLAIAHTRFHVVPLEKMNKEWAVTDATNWFYGWDQLAAELAKYKDVDFILTPSHQLSSEIEYCMKESVPVHVDLNITRFNQYNLWPSPARSGKGKKAIYVSFYGEALDAYKPYFGENPEKIDYLKVYRPGLEVRTYRIVYGKIR